MTRLTSYNGPCTRGWNYSQYYWYEVRLSKVKMDTSYKRLNKRLSSNHSITVHKWQFNVCIYMFFAAIIKSIFLRKKNKGKKIFQNRSWMRFLVRKSNSQIISRWKSSAVLSENCPDKTTHTRVCPCRQKIEIRAAPWRKFFVFNSKNTFKIALNIIQFK